MSRTLLFALTLLLLLAPALTSPPPARAGCQDLVPPGLYEGTTSVVMDIRGYAEGQLVQQFTFNDTGDLTLDIGCTVTGGDYHLNIYRTLMFFPGQPPEVCAYSVDYSNATGNVVVGENGQPRIDVRWGQGVVNGSDCIEAGPAPPATWRFSLASPPDGQEIGGDFRIVYDDPGGQDYDQIAETFRGQGFEVTLNKEWSGSREARPSVLGLTASLRQYFLQGIPVTNRYTASIDWDGNPPGVARFILDGYPPQPMTVNGDIATYDLALGPIERVGDIPISVEAEMNGQVDRLDNLGPLTLVPRPSWLHHFNFQAQPQTGFVRYHGEYRLPSQPIEAHVTLPTLLPYVGGTWGLLPTQLRVPLAANSLGTREASQISAQGGFGLGRRTFTLNASGNVYGTLTHDALQFDSDQLSLSTSGIFFREHLGLLSVVPGASALFNVPVIGGLLQGLDSALGVTADVRGTMTGRGRIGITGDTPALTEGAFDASLRVSAAAGIDTPFAWATVTGGGNGSLSMELVPTTRLLSCQVLLWFQAGAGAFGFQAGPVTAQHALYTCQTATGQVLVLTPEGREAILRTTYGSPALARGERPVTLEALTRGLAETVLAEDTSLQAKPVLVAGANGRLALVWNSLTSSGAADAVSLRLYNGTTWANAVTLSEARPAFTPSAAFAAGGNLLVVWAEAQEAPDPNGITESFARSLEIVWAEVNPDNGQVAQRGRLTTDEMMDFAPRLRAAPDGTVWLGWLASPSTTIAGSTAQPNRLMAARWTGAGWSAPETAASNLVGTLSWELAPVDAAQVWAVADVDSDGTLSSAADRELFIYRRTGAGWAAPFQRTTDDVIDSSPLLALAPGGQPVLAWRHDNTILGLTGDPTTATPQTWFDEDAGVGPMLGGGQLIAGTGGALTLIWPEATAQGQDLWLSRYDPQAGAWSKPAPVFHTAEHRRSPSAALLPGGDIMLGLTAAPVTEETVELGGGGSTTVPSVSESASLRVARIPAAYLPSPFPWSLYLPTVHR